MYLTYGLLQAVCFYFNMKYPKYIFFLFVFLFSCGNDESSITIPNEPDDSGPVGSGNNDVLVWSEEFDYDGTLDEAIWTIEYGNGNNGWGNWEAQYYTANNLEV